MIEEEVKELKSRLIEANGSISSALEEIEYAEKNDSIDENMDEIEDMVSSANQKLNVFQMEVNRAPEAMQDCPPEIPEGTPERTTPPAKVVR